MKLRSLLEQQFSGPIRIMLLNYDAVLLIAKRQRREMQQNLSGNADH